MDSTIKARLKQPVIVHPFLKKVQGDALYGTPVEYLSYNAPGEGIIINRMGDEVRIKFSIYLDGANYTKITEDDLVEIPGKKKYPIQLIRAYPGLLIPWEIMEVLV